MAAQQTSFTVANYTDAEAVLYWVDGDSNELAYATLTPGNHIQQETFDGHTWRLRSSTSPEAVSELIFHADAESPQSLRLGEPPTSSDPSASGTEDEYAKAFYQQRVGVGTAGMSAKAASCVSSGAVIAAAEITRQMLSRSPRYPLSRRLPVESAVLRTTHRCRIYTTLPR